MKNDDIVYSLNVQDIQTVAIEEMDRELSDNELTKVIELLGKKSTGMKRFFPRYWKRRYDEINPN